MNELFRWPSVLTVVAVLLFSGWLHGLRSGRWRPEQDLIEAAERVAQVPMTVGQWSAEAQPEDDGEFYQAGALSHWTRRYTHARTKESVLVILMCGRADRMSVHTPEVCYQGAGFNMAGSPEALTVTWQEISSEASAAFWTALFRKEDNSSAPLRLLWGWNSGGNWQALRHPRWDTADESYLYKMYISLDGAEVRRLQDSAVKQPAGANLRQITLQPGAPTDLRRAQDFLHEFLPKLRESLLPRREETSSTHP